MFGLSSTDFFINFNTVCKPDAWWMNNAKVDSLDTGHNNKLLGVPDFVLEVVAPNDTMDKRDKMALWINSGVEVCE